MDAHAHSPTLDQRTPTSKRFIDITGQKYGRWTVIGFAGFQGKLPKWNCKCICGTEAAIFANSLRSGDSQSCGCLIGDTHRTHGNSQHPLWCIYSNMLARCLNEHAKGYQNYGGRGVTVCQRWRDSFDAFCDDMGERPSLKHSLGRIDNHGHYEPSNCRWETASQQLANTRQCRLVRFNGETKPLSAWAESLGITREAMRLRFKKNASLESIFTTPRGGVVVEGSQRHPKDTGLLDDHDHWPDVFTFGEVLHCEAASVHLARKLYAKLRHVAVSNGYIFHGRKLGTHLLFMFCRPSSRKRKHTTPTEATP